VLNDVSNRKASKFKYQFGKAVRSKITDRTWSGLPDGGFAELVFELTGLSIADVIEHWVSKPNVDRCELASNAGDADGT